MWQQKSFSNEDQKGILYLVPTPIGNLEDMTYRAVRTLKEADIIAAEDTRNTIKLCHYFEIETPIISYHEHNKRSSGDKIIDRLKNGEKVALVSDAGMPAISDPGYELVHEAVSERLAVVPLPGANAALTALIASGLETQPFYFYGFLNRQKKEKRKELEKLAYQTGSLLFYGSPHRLKETLALMHEAFGDRNVVLCRELTKKFEEFIRGSLTETMNWAETNEIRGEFCLVVEGANETEEKPQEKWWGALTIQEHVDFYMNENGISSKEAIKQVAKDRGQMKRAIYQAYHLDK